MQTVLPQDPSLPRRFMRIPFVFAQPISTNPEQRNFKKKLARQEPLTSLLALRVSQGLTKETGFDQ